MHPYIIGGIALLPCAAGAAVVAPLVQGLLARRTFWPSLYMSSTGPHIGLVASAVGMAAIDPADPRLRDVCDTFVWSGRSARPVAVIPTHPANFHHRWSWSTGL